MSRACHIALATTLLITSIVSAHPAAPGGLPAMATKPVPPANQLSPLEQAMGWRLLFDGTTSTNWRGYKAKEFPKKGWKIEEGCLTSIAGAGGGDIVTTDQFGDFELELQFRTTPKSNSGIMFHVAETLDASWQTGPEYQILDDVGYGAGPTDMHSTGALYDLYPPAPGKKLNPPGEWNTARIRLSGGLLRHWLNDQMVVECRTDVPEWTQKIAASKFKDYKGFGVLPKGLIAIQEHGDANSFRNIKVRDLSSPPAGSVSLFNGKDLSGWTFFLNDNGKMEDVWSVRDGMIVCKGTPAGYLRTTTDYTSYVLSVDWRWNPETKKAGNSGVLLRMVGKDKVWPKSVEAQLESGNAGDFWNIDNVKMTTDAARLNGRNTRKIRGSERPVGEWNHYEIVVNGGTITLFVNGEMCNQATDVEVVPGKICLQSEGAEIHFKNISLVPLK